MQLFTPRQYLAIDIASNFGLDKRTWDERLEWFEDHKDRLDDMLPHADEPALFFAGVQAWKAVEAGQPIGYPISLDATASGLQLLAVLTGDRSAAELCNVVDIGKRQDAYTAIYEKMLAEVGETAKISREDCKRSIMTSLYGSKAVPKEVFGEGTLLQVFESTMRTMAPGAWELNEEFLAIWDPTALSNDWVLPDNFHVHIKVMTHSQETVNFLNEPFEISRRINAPMEKGRSLGANTVHSLDGLIVREMTRRCSYDPAWIKLVTDILADEVESHITDPQAKIEAIKMTKILWAHYEKSGYLSARILDYIDSDTIQLVDAGAIQELIESLPAKPFDLISVHDCFRCLPSYGNDLREQYNLQLYLIGRSDMLSFLLGQILGTNAKIGKLDPTMVNDILDANYALS